MTTKVFSNKIFLNQNKKDSEMLKSFVEQLKKIFPEKEKELTEISLEVEKAQPPKAESPSSEPSLLKSIVEELKAENKKVLDELSLYKTKEEQRDKILELKLITEQKEKIEGLIKKAIEGKKIPAKNEELINTYRVVLDKNFEAGEKIINQLPAISEASQTKPAEQTTQIRKSENPILSKILERNQILN